MSDELIRDFKGIWIPKEIWLDDRLNALDKIILVEIDSLDATEEGCYASNKYLAEFCQCTETKISTSISKLIELGYLENINFDGRKRFLKSSLKKIYRQPLKNLKADFKKIKDTNIYNNIDNNIYIYIEENFGRTLNPIEYEVISTWEDNDLTRYAIKQAVLNNAYSIKYIEAILNNWKAKGIKTVQQAQKLKKKNVADVPEWFDKEIVKEERTDEERRKIEAIRNGTYRAEDFDN